MKVKVKKKWLPISLFKNYIDKSRCYRVISYDRTAAHCAKKQIIITRNDDKYTTTLEFGAKLLKEEK